MSSLGGPRDGALLRYSLGNEHLKAGDAATAAYFRDAVDRDPKYSAAWKLLGKILAEARSDVQAAKEMAVFARRIEKRGEARGQAGA